MNFKSLSKASDDLISLSQNSFADIKSHFANKPNCNMFGIQFLGTGQGTHGISSRGLAKMQNSRLISGPILSNGINSVWIDPGPDCLEAISCSKIDPRSIDAILLSHAHVDHTGNILAAIEMITGALELRKEKSVFGNITTIKGSSVSPSVLTNYHVSLLKDVKALEYGDSVQIGTITVEAIPCNHYETSIDNSSLNFRIKLSDKIDICYIDGNVFMLDENNNITNYVLDGLIESCKSAYALIVNVSNHYHMRNCRQNYPSTFGTLELIKQIKPKYMFLTHYGIEMQNPNAKEKEYLMKIGFSNIIEFQQAYLQAFADEYGIDTHIIATKDLMRFNFDKHIQREILE